MQELPDLRTARKQKGLTLTSVAAGLMRVTTLSEIELGKVLPRSKTRRQLEAVLGPIDWVKTLAADRGHIVHAVREFVQTGDPGAKERAYFLKQILTLIQQAEL